MYLQVTMDDESVWNVPVDLIIDDRTDTRECEREETEKYFKQYPDELIDWAENNMNWEDVVESSVLVKEPNEPSYQDGWANGEKKIVEEPTNE